MGDQADNKTWPPREGCFTRADAKPAAKPAPRGPRSRPPRPRSRGSRPGRCPGSDTSCTGARATTHESISLVADLKRRIYPSVLNPKLVGIASKPVEKWPHFGAPDHGNTVARGVTLLSMPDPAAPRNANWIVTLYGARWSVATAMAWDPELAAGDGVFDGVDRLRRHWLLAPQDGWAVVRSCLDETTFGP